MRLAVAVVALLATSGCGGGTTEKDEMNDRYQQCLRMGGDFSTDGNGGWSCTDTKQEGK